MVCIKCKKEIPDDSQFCNLCGKKQSTQKKRKPKSRGNGQGSVYLMPSGKYQVEVTLNYKDKRVRKTKAGFKTRKEALDYIPALRQQIPNVNLDVNFKELYDEWLSIHEAKVTRDTMNCYKAAYKYYAPLLYVKFSDIKTEHLQKCIDECPKGKRTRQNMKALGTLLYKYALQKDIVEKNYAEFIYIKSEEKTEIIGFTSEEVENIKQAVDKVPYADYVYVMIYTGFRINELLPIKVKDYNSVEKCLVGGEKTEAGKNRTITISPKIQKIIDDLVAGKEPDRYIFEDKKEQKKMSDKHFREDFYYPALEQIGVPRLTPHQCRHTFATLMKRVQGADKDKLALMGHTSDKMLRHYQDVSYDDLRKITDNL